MKTLEELKQERDTARAAYNTADVAAQEAYDAWNAAWDAWEAARAACHKKLKEIENENT